jgi:fucose 4-O-acetylase-like acetyltransferase
MPDTKQRIEWIDIAKGLGIIMVIAGHTIALRYSQWLYAFHLPLFFFLSGLVYNQLKYNNYVFFAKVKAKQILLPWVVFFLIALIFCLIIPQWRENLSIHQILVELYTTNSNNIQNSSIWYLICMFVAFNLFYFTNKIKHTKNAIALFILAAILFLWIKKILLLSSTFIPLPGARLPFKMDSAMLALVFLAVANWNKDRFMKFVSAWKYGWGGAILLAVVLFGASVFNGWTNMNSLDCGRIPLLYYPIAFLGIFVVCIFSKLISETKIIHLKKILTIYGKESLVIFGLQSLFIRLYLLTFNELQNLNMELYMNNPLVHQIGSFIVVSFVISPIVVFLKNFAKKRIFRYE